MPQTTVSNTVYFDNAATTPPLPEVIQKLGEMTSTVFGNSSSIHKKGRQAQEILDLSYESVARHFQVPPNHVIFTSGGTESNNLAIWGSLGGLVQAFHWLKAGAGGKLITSFVEHDATKKVFESLQQMCAQVGWLGINNEGFLDLGQLETELSARTRLVSLHHAQNEIGTLQDIKAISQLIRAKQPDALIHIDAVQSFLKTKVNLEELDVDLISISGHKVGGPKGIGALILGRRFESRHPKLGPLINGSPQQFGIRPGTVPVPAIAAFVTAIESGQKNFQKNRAQLLSLRQHLVSKLPQKAVLNGPKECSDSSPHRAPQTINFSIPGLPAAVAVEALSTKGFCVSSGSACHSSNPKPNETLMRMGAGKERALSAIRVSFGAQNTIGEIDGFITALNEVMDQFLWEAPSGRSSNVSSS